MGVQTDSSLRDRRAMPQEDTSGVKRFKPSPVLGPAGTEQPQPTAGLKIRISRCGTNRAQIKSSTCGGGGSEFSAPTSPRTLRLKRARASSSSSSSSREQSPHGGRHAADAVKLEPVEAADQQPDVKPYLAPGLKLSMTGNDVVEECERVGPPTDGSISTSVLNEGVPSPSPLPRSALPKLSREQLLPQTPSVRVRDRAAAFSPQLLEWCLQRPISVIRGIPQV